MKKLIYFLLFCSLTLPSQASDELRAIIDSGNTAYAEGKYQQAILFYEQIVKSDYESFEVYYNLGNAFFKNNEVAFAILYYEKAKKLNPKDEDLLFNLQMTNRKIVDKIEELPELKIAEIGRGFVGSLSGKSWAVLCILLFFTCILLFIAYLFVGQSSTKRIAFWLSIFVFVLSTSSFLLARSSYRQAEKTKEAIIIAATVTVKSAPTATGTKLFVVHEGTKVKLMDRSGDWIEIKLANGSVGWMKQEMLATI